MPIGLKTGVKAALPQYSIAVVQSEVEQLRTPGHDILPFFRGKSHFRHESFTEKTLGALAGSLDRFDCVLVGFNAIYQCPRIADDVLASGPHAVVLHQKEERCFSFLTDNPIELHDLPHGAETDLRQAGRHLGREEQSETLLAWPHSIAPGAVHADAICHFRTPADSLWRTAIETTDGLAVVVRSARTRAQRVALTNLLLEPRDPVHADLLENMLLFAAAGPHEVVVVRPESAEPRPEPWALAQKLRLQGAIAVELIVPRGAEPSFRDWPRREAQQVVVIDTDVSLADQEWWLNGGGNLITAPDPHELSVTFRPADARWVARRWATWLAQAPPSVWQSRMYGFRTTMRMFEAIDRLPSGVEAVDPLGLEYLRSKAPAAAHALLARRVSADGHCERTVSTTAAALDIASLAPDALPPERRRRVEEWLRNEFDTASLEDRFDIARALADRRLFDRAVDGAPDGASGVALVRMLEAAAACGAEPARSMTSVAALEACAREFESRILLSAELLLAIAAPNAGWHEDAHNRLVQSLPADVAVTSLLRSNSLARSDDAVAPDTTAEEVTTEALALIAFFGLSELSALPLRPGAAGVSGPAVDSVLREMERTRERDDSLRSENEAATHHLREAGVFLAILTLVVTVLVFVSARELGGGLIEPLAAAGAAFVILSTVFVTRGLFPGWARSTAVVVAGGIEGLRERLTHSGAPAERT